jgi:hypothetical protein
MLAGSFFHAEILAEMPKARRIEAQPFWLAAPIRRAFVLFYYSRLFSMKSANANASKSTVLRGSA